MKKIIFIAIILSAISYKLTAAVLAAASTSSAISTPSAASSDKRAQDLLDRVATKVAQLSDQSRRTYHGSVKAIGSTTYTLNTPDGDKTILTNDATSFYRIRAGSRSETDFKGIKVGDDIAVLGTIDPQSTDMTAKQIIAKIQRFNFIGQLSSIDKDNVATITSSTNQTSKVDLSDALALKKFDQTFKIATAKLTDFKEGQQIFVIAHSPDSKTGVYSVLKALTFIINKVK